MIKKYCLFSCLVFLYSLHSFAQQENTESQNNSLPEFVEVSPVTHFFTLEKGQKIRLNFDLRNSFNAKVTLKNIVGKVVWQEEKFEEYSKQPILVPDLSEGNYVLQVQLDDQLFVSRLLVRH